MVYKRYLTVTISLLIFSFVFSVDLLAADLYGVEMVSFDQGDSDLQATVALKNNTNKEIYGVSFTIEYLDTNGNQLDYHSYVRAINIAPGKTRKVDIPAYERSRNYVYYKSKSRYDFDKRYFKVRYIFEKGYYERVHTREIDEISEIPALKDDSSLVTNLSPIILTIVVLGLYFSLYVFVALMAQCRDRSPILWLLISILFTPILTCIILLIIGNNNRDNEV